MFTPAAQRRTERRATPATLTGVSGRPTLASALEMKSPIPENGSSSEGLEPDKADRSGQQDNSQFRCHGHWPPPIENCLGQFIDVDELLQIDLLGVGRRLEGELVRRSLLTGLPVADLDAVLRSLVDSLGGYDVSAGVGLLALRDPYLPIDLLGPETPDGRIQCRRSRRCRGP